MGGKIRLLINRLDPISNNIKQFLKVTLSSPMIEAYGLLDSTGPLTCVNPNDPTLNHVGGVCVNAEMKVIDIPEMGYLSTDINKKGLPEPRGEVCFKGHSIISGYYKMD